MSTETVSSTTLVFVLAGKKGATPATKGKTATGPSKTEPKEPPKKKWTKEDEAARVIQTQARQYLARKERERKKKEKEEYEALMDRLEKEVMPYSNTGRWWQRGVKFSKKWVKPSICGHLYIIQK